MQRNAVLANVLRLQQQRAKLEQQLMQAAALRNVVVVAKLESQLHAISNQLTR